jgi:hypothetical protein
MFPIHRANYRTLDPDFTGQVFVADIDRTYLATRFSSLSGMARIPFERAEEKRDIDGMARLFREIRMGPAEQTRDTPLFFVSASPYQLRPVIERKMVLDGIGFDGTTFKDWSGVVKRMRLHRLREQIGFKLTALVAHRADMPEGAEEVLIGDDLENDPLTYSLYADMLARRIPSSDVERILAMNGVLPGDARDIARSVRDLKPGRGVLRACIRLERFSDPDDFVSYGPGIVPCKSAFQMSVALWRIGSISRAGIGRVAHELVGRGSAPERMTEQLGDLVRLALLPPGEARELAAELAEKNVLALPFEPGSPDPKWVKLQARDHARLWTPPRYVGE